MPEPRWKPASGIMGALVSLPTRWHGECADFVRDAMSDGRYLEDVLFDVRAAWVEELREQADSAEGGE